MEAQGGNLERAASQSRLKQRFATIRPPPSTLRRTAVRKHVSGSDDYRAHLACNMAKRPQELFRLVRYLLYLHAAWVLGTSLQPDGQRSMIKLIFGYRRIGFV